MPERSFEDINREYLPQIEKFFTEFWDAKAKKTTLGIEPLSVEMSRYQLSTGGKRLRALLPLYIFAAYGKDLTLAIPLGAGIEIIHNATLIHDDLQDGDKLRRGKPTVWMKFSAAQAINSGDAMFFYALQCFEKLNFPIDIKSQISALAIDSTLHVIEGQSQEFLMKTEEFPKVGRYLDVISGKTSGLFRLPILSSLLALGLGTNSEAVNSDLIAVAESAADDLGRLFQIQDDHLDLYGAKQREQKASDISEGKISFFVAHVNEHGLKVDRANLAKILKTPRENTSAAQIDEALDIFDRSGAKKASLDYMLAIKEKLSISLELEKYPELKSIFVKLSQLFLSLV